jgi:hypothetical protein
LELQARCGLRIGESLKIKVSDVSERRILLREPKLGKEAEVAYMPEPVCKEGWRLYPGFESLIGGSAVSDLLLDGAGDDKESRREAQDEDHAA